MDRDPVCRAQRTATSLASPILQNRRGGLFSHTSQDLHFFLQLHALQTTKEKRRSAQPGHLGPRRRLAYALSTLEKRYGEKFSQAEGAEVSASYESDYSKPPPTNYARGPTLTRRKTSAALLKPTTTPISWHSLWTTTPNIASRIR